MKQDLDAIDHTVAKTYDWLRLVSERAGLEGHHRAYLALRAVLHALLDWDGALRLLTRAVSNRTSPSGGLLRLLHPAAPTSSSAERLVRPSGKTAATAS